MLDALLILKFQRLTLLKKSRQKTFDVDEVSTDKADDALLCTKLRLIFEKSKQKTFNVD